MAFLGMDLGTSGLRALLVDDAGSPLGSVERAYPSHSPYPGWSEQDPSDWIAALTSAIEELRSTRPQFRSIRGIGVSGHMHGAVLLDKQRAVIRPCIMWNDSRSHAEAAALDTAPGVRDLSGNIVFPGFTAPKLEWLRHNEPEAYARIAKVVLPTGFLNLFLTGEAVADMSDSAGTSWLDVGKRDWSDNLLTTGHMRIDQMPRLVEGCAKAGQLRPALAHEWGLSTNVVIAGGAGDNAAAACGIGALSDGQGFVSLGTSGVLLVARDRYCPMPETALHTFCHAVPGRWYQMGVMLSATQSLNWFSRITGQSPLELDRLVGDDLQPPGPARFLPYLSGERTPHNDAHIRAGFIGLGTQTDTAGMVRAIMEGVAFGLRDSFEATKAAGARLSALQAIGGGTASPYWVQVLATVLNVPLWLPEGREFGAALGAARLAIVAATGEPPENVMRPPDCSNLIEPDIRHVAAFGDAYERFKETYPAIRSIQ